MARVAYPELDPSPFLRQLQQMGAHRPRSPRDWPGRLAAQAHAAADRHRVRLRAAWLRRQPRTVRRPAQQPAERRAVAPDGHPDHAGAGLHRRRATRRPGVEGVNFPGHFLVRCLPDGTDPADQTPLLVDPFHAGVLLTDAECTRLLRANLGVEAIVEPGMLRTATKRDVLLRMLLNLKRAYVRLRSLAQAHAVTELLVALDPAALTELRDRGLLASQLHDYAAAFRDLETWLRLAPPGEDDRDERTQVWDHVKDLRRRAGGAELAGLRHWHAVAGPRRTPRPAGTPRNAATTRRSCARHDGAGREPPGVSLADCGTRPCQTPCARRASGAANWPVQGRDRAGSQREPFRHLRAASDCRR